MRGKESERKMGLDSGHNGPEFEILKTMGYHGRLVQ